MADAIEDAQFKRAKFTFESGPDKGTSFDVHFNPASLGYAITNNLESQEGGEKKQFVGSSTGKLTMDLVFDTTHDGQDVREHTNKVARMLKPDPTDRVPPVVTFAWGVYVFKGVVESYKETIDFFAPSGVPLRAAINLTLASQETVFDFERGPRVDVQGKLALDPVQVPPKPNGGVSDIAAKAGNPRAARALGAANGVESLRFGGGAAISVMGGATLRAPTGFAPTASLSAGASASVAGGAFAKLGTKASVSTRLDPAALLPRPASTGLATDRNASFGVGGQASIEGAASLKADVGSGASLRGRIRFGG